MALPRDRFEVAWTAGPWDTNPFWVDCTPWLLGVSRERGRQPRDTVNRASKLTAWLNNRDGRFTMQNGPTATNLPTGTWSSLGGTLANNGGWFRLTGTGTAIGAQQQVAVVAGTTYQYRGLTRQVTVARNAKLELHWYNASSVLVSVASTGFMAEGMLSLSAVAPAGATTVLLRVEWTGVPSGEAHDFALWALAASTTALPPYWPNVEPRHPCRWVTDFGGVTYPRFEGLLESLPTEWTDFSEEVATFTAAGRLAALADVDLPGSVWETTVKGLAPNNWWQLEEPAATDRFYDSGSASQPAVIQSNPGSGVVNVGAVEPTDGAPFIPGSARAFERSWARASPSPIAGSGNWTVVTIARIDFTRPVPPARVASTFLGTQHYLWTLVDAAGTQVQGLGFSNLIGYNATTDPVAWEAEFGLQGRPVYVALEGRLDTPNTYRTDMLRDGWFVIVARRIGTTATLFADGRLENTQTMVGSLAATQFILGDTGATSPQQGTAVIDDTVVWTRALTDAEVATVSAAAADPWRGDSAHTRYDRFPALTGIPAARMVHGTTGADAGQTLGRTHLGGKALSYLHQLARSVRGRMLDTVDGNIELRTGGDLLNMRTPVATFGQQAGDLPYAKIGTDPSFERIITAARAKNVEGTVKETEATDLVPGTTQTYIQKYGRRGPTEGEIGDLLLETDQQAKDFTSWLVSAGKKPDVALDPLVLHPLGDDAVTLAVLDGRLELDKVVTVRKKHPAQTDTVTATARIAGINETVNRTTRGLVWTYALRLEPLDPTPYSVADGSTLADGSTVAF